MSELVAGQFRLSELSVYNWGSFNSLHTATIDSQGTLITGDNGSGKSTFIDGLMALLLPAGKASFNVAAAQGDRSDRSLISYMRGNFGSEHDGVSTRVKSKREGAVVTGLRALYRSDEGSAITLAALFWTTQATNTLAEIKRIYVIAERNLTLPEILNAFGTGNTRELKQWLRSDSSIKYCDDNFSEYQESYRRLLRMENKNAPALLARALGLKKIDDLTGLIRELVLEPSTVKEDAKKVVDEFADLVAIHSQLLDAREQRNHLARLPDLSVTIAESQTQMHNLQMEKDGLSVYLGEVCSVLWSDRVESFKKTIDNLLLEKKRLEQSIEDGEELVERRHAEYLKFGGDRLESLKKEIDLTNTTLDRIVKESSKYQEDIKHFAWSGQLTEEIFIKNQNLADEKLQNAEKDSQDSQDSFAVISGRLSLTQNTKRELSGEIEAIKARPDSNIDIKFQELRDELVNSLGLAKENFMFIGELIDVENSERPWQGAIERALGGLRTTLLVPGDSFSMVTRWLNARHTGLHVRVQVVNELSISVQFKADGYLQKLIWREHAYREWVKAHLNRFDLRCVSTTDELDRTPFSMTQQGLIHLERGRFEKKDQYFIDDRRKWNLGFSNKARLSILMREAAEAEKQLFDLAKQVAHARETLNAVSAQKLLLERIKTYRWIDIDAHYWQNKVSVMRKDLLALEQVGSDLEQAKWNWEAAKGQLEALQEEKNSVLIKEGGLNKSLQDAEARLHEAREVSFQGLSDELRTRFEVRIGALTIQQLDSISSISESHGKQIENELEGYRGRKTKSENSAIGIMASFRSNQKWQSLTVDWQTGISGLSDFIEYLENLEKDGLQHLVEHFIERLNKHATQSLARIHQRLESEREEISERIDIINLVLRRTEFRDGSHLKLGVKKEKYPHTQDFEKQVAKALSQATSDDHEGRFHQLEKVVAILDKASSPVTSGNLESLRLLDPRYQMSFYAEELDTQTFKVRDVLESSSGKSGGEKESFAGIVVAASLAYVLTPEGQDRPVYSTVFLDEAFSNTAEAASRRVLRVFKELNIHVNLITPYKNLNLARQSARSLLIVERNAEIHDSRLCEVTWDEIDRRLAARRNDKIESAKVEYEIESESE